MMKYLLLAVFALLIAAPARADQPEAREVARINNCPPKKIDVYRSSPGRLGETMYQVTCDLPKATDKDAPAGPDALLISCDGSLCEMVRALSVSGQ